MNTMNKIWLVGGSSGIGLELAQIFLKNNHKVVISSRNANENTKLLELKKEYEKNLNLVDLDVNKDDLKKEVEKAWKSFDGLDLWFYNVGSYDVTDINNWDKDKFIQMNMTNYLGAVKIMIELLPYFEKQKWGKWVWNLSLSTYFGLPKAGAYSAPKAALLNLAQTIHPELTQKNLQLQVINHGFVKTRLTKKNPFDMPQLMSPKEAANKIYYYINKNDKFEIHFPFKLSLTLKILSLLPYKISLYLTKKML